MRPPSLRQIGIVCGVLAFMTGVVANGLWFKSMRDWDVYLDKAYLSGVLLYDSLLNGSEPPQGVTITVLPPRYAQQAEQNNFDFASDSGLRSGRVTLAPVLVSGASNIAGAAGTLAIVGQDRQYRISDIISTPEQSGAEKIGNVTRLMATFCDPAPALFVRTGDTKWFQVTADAVWSCAAAPYDFRLWVMIGTVIVIGGLYTALVNTTMAFGQFADALRSRRRIGGPDSYAYSGPQELHDTVDAINTYLAQEREQLEDRATVLSGISHDLGTPATRLRLRTALIEDQALREKLERDIDQMTGIIESVLTYTRSELNAEAPRKLSLTSLIQSLADDYQDIGKPVEFIPLTPTLIETGTSVFSGLKGATKVEHEFKIIVTARPLALQRAVNNLIDNALKYGRNAKISLQADADFAAICIEDSGQIHPEQMAKLTAPFKRGDNIGQINGHGLGLSIVQTIAQHHGGALDFERSAHGLRAIMKIRRD